LSTLRARVRLAAGRQAEPTAADIDWADGGYAGKVVIWAREILGVALTIVKRSDDTTGFHVLPRRWVVERTLAWIARHRRCVRDYERLPEHHEAMVRWTMIRITSKRLTNKV
jgi:transposase